MRDGDETLYTRGFMYVPCAHQVSWPSGTAAPTPDLTLAYFAYVSQGAKYVRVRPRVGCSMPDGDETLHTHGFMYITFAHQVSWSLGFDTPTPDLTLAYFAYVPQVRKIRQGKVRGGSFNAGWG